MVGAPPPPVPGAPPPPPPGAAATGPTPSRAVKPLHWTKLPAAVARTSVWGTIDAAAAAALVDTARVEESFAAKPPPKPRGGARDGGGGGARASGDGGGAAAAVGGGSAAGGAKKGGGGMPLHVLSVKRANNVGIFLAKRLGKMSAAQLCDGVLALDDAVLTADMLEALLLNLSDEPEAKALRALRVAPEELAPAELFCHRMAQVPRLRPMLEALRLRLALPALLERAAAALADVAAAAGEIMASPTLVRVLASLLAHGNFLNAENARGAAVGVRLDALDKARALKTADGRTSLLALVLAAADASRMGALVAELAHVRRAAKVPLVEAVLLVNEARAGARAIEQELALCPVPDIDDDLATDADADADADAGGGDAGARAAAALPPEQQLAQRFRSAAGAAHAAVAAGLAALGEKQEEVKATLRRLAAFVGEDPNKADPDAIFRAARQLLEDAAAQGPS